MRLRALMDAASVQYEPPAQPNLDPPDKDVEKWARDLITRLGKRTVKVPALKKDFPTLDALRRSMMAEQQRIAEKPEYSESSQGIRRSQLLGTLVNLTIALEKLAEG